MKSGCLIFPILFLLENMTAEGGTSYGLNLYLSFRKLDMLEKIYKRGKDCIKYGGLTHVVVIVFFNPLCCRVLLSDLHCQQIKCFITTSLFMLTFAEALPIHCKSTLN